MLPWCCWFLKALLIIWKHFENASAWLATLISFFPIKWLLLMSTNMWNIKSITQFFLDLLLIHCFEIYFDHTQACLTTAKILLKSTFYLYGYLSTYLKPDFHLPKKVLFICFNESPLKMMKNAFYFILKALFVLKILNFLSWHFGHIEETA